ncbi:D-alanine---D-serine ligase [Clostridiales Family XIII bacterium PM5-7]
MKKTIAIIFGGCSNEYEVSLQSAYAVLSEINTSTYNPVPIGITKEGEWFRYSGDIENIPTDQWHFDRAHCTSSFISPDRCVHGIIDIKNGKIDSTYLDGIFPVLHGKNGEDGTVQGLAELAGIPVVGCGVLASALCMDKYRAHLIAKAAGIRVPEAVYLASYTTTEERRVLTASLHYPLYVKPVKSGSSLGITRITSAEELDAAVENAFNYDDAVIVEESVDGFEVGCSVLGNDVLTVGRVDEIELTEEWFDYHEKYTQLKSTIHMPARIDSAIEAKIKDCAKTLYRALGCSGFARVDMFLTPDREIVFNEINTIPGFTAHSRYPKMLSGIGLSFGGIIDVLLERSLAS